MQNYVMNIEQLGGIKWQKHTLKLTKRLKKAKR